MASPSFRSLLQQFREAISGCRQLYVAAGRECAEQFPHLISEPPGEFLNRMDDLHKGLLLKIYFSVAEADQHWSHEEQQMAEVLFHHLWQRSLFGKQLRETARHISRQTQGLDWYSLVRPFDQIARSYPFCTLRAMGSDKKLRSVFSPVVVQDSCCRREIAVCDW